MSRSQSTHKCATCGLPVKDRPRKGKSHWTHLVNAATASSACEKPVPERRRGHAGPLAVGTRISIYHPAGTITVNGRRYARRFTPDRFAHLVTDAVTFPIRRRGVVTAYVVVTAARVRADGSGVTFDMEVIDVSEEEAA